MTKALQIPTRRRARLPLARRARPSPRSRRRPVPQGAHAARSTSAAASSTPPPTSPTASACAPASPRAMVDYPIGDLIAERVRAMGVTPFYKRFKHDGARGPNMATVYSDQRLRRARPGRLLQPRQRSRRAAEARRLRLGRRSSAAACAGSTAAASSRRCPTTTPELIIEGMQAAKAHGAVVSFDLNYREKLWNASGGAARAPSGARPHRRARRRARRQRRGPAEGPRHSRARRSRRSRSSIRASSSA